MACFLDLAGVCRIEWKLKKWAAKQVEEGNIAKKSTKKFQKSWIILSTYWLIVLFFDLLEKFFSIFSLEFSSSLTGVGVALEFDITSLGEVETSEIEESYFLIGKLFPSVILCGPPVKYQTRKIIQNKKKWFDLKMIQ